MGKYADRYFQVHPWKIIEEGFDPDYSQVAESIFSLGNEYTGLRGYFDEGYSGPRLQGSYLNGVHERRMLPKSGYKGMIPFTEFMVNTVDWVYTRISSGEQVLDLAKCRFSDFRRELDLRTGVLTRRFVWHIDEHTAVEICFERFTSMEQEQLVGQKLTLRAAKGSPVLTLRLGLDFTCPHVSVGSPMFRPLSAAAGEARAEILAETKQTRQQVWAGAVFHGLTDTRDASAEGIPALEECFTLEPGQARTVTRVVTLCTARTEAEKQTMARRTADAKQLLARTEYETLKDASAAWWEKQWKVSDIEIDGDPENQQGIENDLISPESIPDNGNRLLVGNGCLGIRGTLEEAGKEQLAAVNIAGIYDRVGDGWREPLNAPNPLDTRLRVNGQMLSALDGSAARHTQSLDFRHGICRRDTTWNADGVCVRLQGAHAAHMGQEHLILASYTVSVDRDAQVEIIAKIETDIWEIYGPHYLGFENSVSAQTLLCVASVQNHRDTVAVGRKCLLSLPAQVHREDGALHFCRDLKAGQRVTLNSVCAVYTTRDCPDPAQAVREALESADYSGLRDSHCRNWEKIWAVGAIEIEGDDQAQDALNYSLYHLNSIAPRNGKPLSIPARGLSGQTYKGAIFWDSEMFILDYFLYTQPEVARSMVRYRIETLPGALEKAKQYGWQGAFYAWESQEGGFDACSDYNVTNVFTGRPMRTFFRDKQYHISAAVARAIMVCVQVTQDHSILAQGGAETVLECARFYYSLLLRHPDREQWEIHDAIGPDEYHERVNNNAYTNQMARKTIQWAAEAAALLEARDPEGYRAFAEKTGAEALLPKLTQAARMLYVPQPNAQGVIEQFDGYFGLEDTTVAQVRSRLKDPREYWGGAYGVASQTQVIKQADVITMLELCHQDYPVDILKANWDYYCPRTEHGSSLSACMYALVACRFGAAEEAYPFFLKSARADWDGGGKQWAGLVYIGGTHPAASGGAWKVFAQGFAGLEAENGQLTIRPQLPEKWNAIRFRCRLGDQVYQITTNHEKGGIETS